MSTEARTSIEQRLREGDSGPGDYRRETMTMAAEQLERLKAFVVRVAEFSDYTHDDVSEAMILHELQRDAQTILVELERVTVEALGDV